MNKSETSIKGLRLVTQVGQVVLAWRGTRVAILGMSAVGSPATGLTDWPGCPDG